MLVKSRMRKQVHMVYPEMSIEEARRELRRNRIHHLPVVKDERLVGIVSDRDLRAPASGAKIVGDVMTANPIVVSPAVPVDEAARVMRKKQINSLPVVDTGKVVGIFTASDVLAAFVDLSGVKEPSCHLLIGAKGRPEMEAEVREIIKRCRGEITWLHHKKGNREDRVSLRLKGRDPDDIATALQAAGFDVSTIFNAHEQVAA